MNALIIVREGVLPVLKVALFLGYPNALLSERNEKKEPFYEPMDSA